MKIVLLDGYTTNPGDISWEELKSFGDVTIYDHTEDDMVEERIGDADVVLVNKIRFKRDRIKRLEKVKYIGVLATGYDIIDLEAASQAGIRVSNIPAYSTESVVQMTIALMLELSNHMAVHDKAVKNGEWQKCRDFCFWKKPIIELAGKNLGIIGHGKIGQRVCEMARAFSMNIIVWDRTGNKVSNDEKLRYADFETLMRESDVVSLHCPLFDETKNIINEKSLSLMKKDALLVNTSRGGLIDEEALYHALENEIIAGAAIDVLPLEPPKEGSILFKAKNIIITPHIAWASKESRERLLSIACENIRTFEKGEPINVVNK